jgi:hypothetical protein
MRGEICGLGVALAFAFFGCSGDHSLRADDAGPSESGSAGNPEGTGGATAGSPSSGGSRTGGSTGAGGAAGKPASGGATDASVDGDAGVDTDASDAAPSSDATLGDAQVPVRCLSGLPDDMARLDTTLDLAPDPPDGGGPAGTMSALVSRDGTTVAGAFITDARAHLGHWYRWSGNDFTDLGAVGPLVTGTPTAIDCTGDTLAGHLFAVPKDPGDRVSAHVLRWRKGESFRELAPTYAAEPSTPAFVNAISADGEIILGRIGESPQLTRWIGNGAPEPVNTGGAFDGPENVSFDAEGRVFLGTSGRLATLWRSGQAVVRITEANAYSTTPSAISAGGDYVVGTLSLQTGAGNGYLWNAKTGIVRLGNYLIPRAVSANGTVVVGLVPPGGGPDSEFIWDKAHGARSLASVLASYDLHLPAGFRIVDLTGVSDDGRVVVGSAVDSSGNQAAFRAVLPKAATE